MPNLCARFAALFLLAMAVLLPLAAAAQDGTAPALLTEQKAALDSLRKRVDQLQDAIASSAGSDDRLVDIRLALDETSRDIIGSGVAFRPRLTAINDRLSQLGSPPGDGQPPEPDAISAERKALVAEKAGINALLGTAEQLSIRTENLTTRVASLRRALFSGLLTRRTPINAALLEEVRESTADEAAGLGRSIAAWAHFALRFKLQPVLAACFFAALAAAALLFGGRRLFRPVLRRDAAADPSPLDRLATAFWSTVLPTGAFCVFLGATWFLFDYFGILRGDIGVLLRALFLVLAAVAFVFRLGDRVLAPKLPNWRLIGVESRPASLLLALVVTMALFNGADFLLAAIFELRGSPLALTVAVSFLAAVAIGLLLLLIGLVKPFAHPDGSPKPWPASVRALIFGLSGLTILPALTGYIGLARFASRQAVMTGAILGLMYIGVLLARALSEDGALARSRFGARLQTRLQLDEGGLDGIAVALGLTVNLLVLAAGIPLILLQWGFQPGDLRAWAIQAASGFSVGTLHVSPVGVLTGLALFVAGYLLTRWFQNWLDGSVLARGRVDSGVRNSIRLVVGYAGLALAGLIAISAAGISLSSLALVAGALSLGIGFGLQNIVSNFVSGLILLAERPFKVGDWIVAGAVTGTVKKISVRATEVETFQRQTVILPNSSLINDAVGNWTHRNKLGRVDIKVSVAYGADMRRAHAALLEAAKAHPLVLKNPEPIAVLLNFAPTAVEMELRVFLADILNQNMVGNDLRFAILEAFRRDGIEMPGMLKPGEAPAPAAAPHPQPAPEEEKPPVQRASRRSLRGG